METSTREDAESKPRSRPWLRWAKIAFRVAIFAAVALGIAHTVRKSLSQFEEQRFRLDELRVGWLLFSGLLYLVGSLPTWWFWHRVLVAMGQAPGSRTSLRAFYIGHLGKYVPGKAMVVVLRAGMVGGPQVSRAVAATAVFVETLTTMAVGAVVAAAILAWRFQHDWRLLALALILAICAGVPAWPPIFRRVVRLLRLHRASPEIEPALRALDFRLMASGWGALSLSWLALGGSLWATLAAMPRVPESLFDLPTSLPLLTACAALAMVAGFVSLIPGGVGVREFVVMTLLAPVFGEATAVVSAILLRFIWLLAELASSAILYWVRDSVRDAQLEEGTS